MKNHEKLELGSLFFDSPIAAGLDPLLFVVLGLDTPQTSFLASMHL